MLRRVLLIVAIAAAALTATADNDDSLTGAVRCAGSSTVGPVTEAVAEEFADLHPDVKISIVENGTGGGFKKFVVGETDISNASRPIKPAEIEAADDNGVDFIELPVGYDGITVCVNRANDWAFNITVDQLRRLFRDGSTVSTWRDLDPAWPAVPIDMHIPGTDSGTFDYFKEHVIGEDTEVRDDVTVSENDNTLIRGIMASDGAIGFFGCSYYFQNREKIRSLGVKTTADSEPVRPTPTTIEEGAYKPLSRPLFIYVNRQSLRRPEVREFVEFYLDEGGDIAEQVGYVALPSRLNFLAKLRYNRGYTGSIFWDAEEEEQLEGPLFALLRADHKAQERARNGG
jgi:phosphate transport system substrate-binding protein